MAANYWESTQRKYWQFTKSELADLRKKLEDEDKALVQTYPLPQLRHISIFFNQRLKELAKKIGARQQVLATAQLYLRRFYTKVEIRRTNPYLLMATALYLACKTEESPVHIRLFVSETRSVWGEHFNVHDMSKVGECEFFLISEMNSQMIVHQPYRSLNVLAPEFALTAEETQLASTIINDHYMTDLPLLYAPHVIALSAILLVLAPSYATQATQRAGTTNPVQAALQRVNEGRNGMGGDKKAMANSPTTQSKILKFSQWLSASTVDIEAMIDACQEMISFYEVLDTYKSGHEKTTNDQIHRFIRGRNLDK